MKRLAMFLLLPSFALGGDFVTNPSTVLPGPKFDSRPLKPGDDPKYFLRASDFNAVREAASDLRDHTSGWGNAKSYAGSGSVTGTHLAQAATDAAAKGMGLLIAHPVTISSALGTISVPVRFEGGGKLVLASGGSVTLSGALDAPLTQIFDVQGGTLTFQSRVAAVYPQWWGAKGDGVADDTAAVQAMVAVLGSRDVTVIVSGPLKVTSFTVLPSTMRFRFEGGGAFVGPGIVTHARWNADGRRIWDTEPTPWIAGRSGLVNPENTPYSWDPAVSAGGILEMDIWRTADDGLVVTHDKDTIRVTGVSIDVTKARMEDLRILNAAGTRDPALFPRTPIPLLEEVLAKYARRCPMILEIKGDVRAATLAAHLVRMYGLQDSVAISSFGLVQHQAVHAVDPTIRTILLSDGSGGGFPTPATAVEYGAWAVGLSIVYGITPESVAAYRAAGLRVFGWSTDWVYEIELELAKGLDGIYTDSTPYVKRLINGSTPSGTSVAPPLNLLATGWRIYKSASPAAPGAAFDGAWATFDQVTEPSGVYLIYPGIRTPEGTYSIATTLKLQKASATTSNVIGLRIGFASDHDTGYLGRPAAEGLPSNGYYFKYGANGSVGISRVDANVATPIASATWAALAEGTAVPLRIDVTPTTITVTQTSSAQSITATDATLPRRGFFSAFGNNQVPALGATTITY